MIIDLGKPVHRTGELNAQRGGGGDNYEQKQKTKKSKPHFIQYIIAVKLPKYTTACTTMSPANQICT
jgi:hypothetical protein